MSRRRDLHRGDRRRASIPWRCAPTAPSPSAGPSSAARMGERIRGQPESTTIECRPTSPTLAPRTYSGCTASVRTVGRIRRALHGAGLAHPDDRPGGSASRHHRSGPSHSAGGTSGPGSASGAGSSARRRVRVTLWQGLDLAAEPGARAEPRGLRSAGSGVASGTGAVDMDPPGARAGPIRVLVHARERTSVADYLCPGGALLAPSPSSVASGRVGVRTGAVPDRAADYGPLDATARSRIP